MATIFTDTVEHATIIVLGRRCPKFLTAKWRHSSTRHCFSSDGQRHAVEVSLYHSPDLILGRIQNWRIWRPHQWVRRN